MNSLAFLGLEVQVLSALSCTFVLVSDKDTSRAHKRTYNKISDVQRSKLQEYYDGGMKTCGSDNTEKIGVAAEETGLTIDQVKVRYFLVGLKHYHVSYMWNTLPLICISWNNNSDHCGDCFFLQSTPTYVNDVAVYCPSELIPLLCVLHKRIFLKDWFLNRISSVIYRGQGS